MIANQGQLQRVFHKNYSKIYLHPSKADDINPIIEIVVSARYLRHCSKRYQINLVKRSLKGLIVAQCRAVFSHRCQMKLKK